MQSGCADGDKSYTQNKETYKKTRIKSEQRQYVMRVWVPVKDGEVAKETEGADGQSFCDICRGE